MNKRQSKKQKRLEAVKLLESLKQYGAGAVAMVDNSGCAIILEGTRVEMERMGASCYSVVHISGIVSKCIKVEV